MDGMSQSNKIIIWMIVIATIAIIVGLFAIGGRAATTEATRPLTGVSSE